MHANLWVVELFRRNFQKLSSGLFLRSVRIFASEKPAVKARLSFALDVREFVHELGRDWTQSPNIIGAAAVVMNAEHIWPCRLRQNTKAVRASAKSTLASLLLTGIEDRYTKARNLHKNQSEAWKTTAILARMKFSDFDY